VEAALSAEVTAEAEAPCDLCGTTEAFEVPHAREYTGGQPVHICARCGFVYVKRRRSADEIAATWSEEIFGEGYTARIPAVVGRLTQVVEAAQTELGLEGKDVCEIGAGEGEFLELARARGARVFGIEPSEANCGLMRDRGIRCFAGTIERYEESGGERTAFDLVAILWTLENCRDCRRMLAGAHNLLRPGGHVLVATGSRLLVPFKKPLWSYFSANPADTHAFRFSANTLRKALAVSGFRPGYVNRYLDSDVLLVIGEQAEASDWEGDDPLAVYSFFERWHADTAVYFPRP
jgi:2-polyprenyl-3-methyl-5-hydroxy-6-metoxy-1,4-benzoquinol methylase